MDPRLPDRIQAKITATHGPIQPLPNGRVSWPCWEWTGFKNHGYGALTWEGKTRYAHRIVFELMCGPIPPRTDIDHLCRNIACVNPYHLEAVTHQENLRRAHSWRTHCVNGHELTPENSYINPRGNRSCRTCLRANQRRFQERRRASLKP